MTRVAILDEAIPEQIKENPTVMSGIELVWAGTDPEELHANLGRLRPEVLILDIDRLPGDPLDWQQKLLESSDAKLVLSVYRFARRELVSQLGSERVRPVKAPVSLERLRMQMMSLIVRGMLEQRDDGAANDSARAAPARARKAPRSLRPAPEDELAVPERVFSQAQLGRLQEIKSSIDCECPNHLAEILQSLVAFEDYSANCQNRNDEDAAVHHALYLATGRARAVMERALARLMAHEGIAL